MAEYKDSISQVSTRMSSRSSRSIQAKATAKRAELLCRQRLLKEAQELEERHLAMQQARQQEELRLQKEKENLALKVEIEATEASIKAMENYEDDYDKKIRFRLQDEIDQPGENVKVEDRLDVDLTKCDSSGKEGSYDRVENPWPSPAEHTHQINMELMKERIEAAAEHSLRLPTLTGHRNLTQHYGMHGQQVDIQSAMRDPWSTGHAQSIESGRLNDPMEAGSQLSRQRSTRMIDRHLPPQRDMQRQQHVDIQSARNDHPMEVSCDRPNPGSVGHTQSSETGRLNDHIDAASQLRPQAPTWTPHRDLPNDISELTKLLIKQQIRASLPVQRITPFSGDPLQYTTFVKAFEFGVEDKTTDARDRLNYLSQYTTGEAQNLVNSCLHYEDAEQGYHKAKSLLATKYGDGHIIAQSILTKARDWSGIKAEEADKLNKFALFLNECKNMMSTVSALTELNHTACITLLVGKLPFRMRSAWRTRVYEIEEISKRSANFEDFVNFVDRQARIHSNPAYGNISDSNYNKGAANNKKDQKDSRAVRRKAFTTGVKGDTEKTQHDKDKEKTQRDKDKEKTCLYCGDSSHHATLNCRKLENLNPKQKTTFCFKSGLCFGCLGAGHRKSNCERKDIQCKKCSGNHPTVLHNDEWHKKKSTEKEETPIPTGCAGVLGAGKSSHGTDNPRMAIVPVLVKASSSHQSIATYAFLDDGCGAVFADDEICSALNVTTRKRSLILKTLVAEQTVDSAVVVDSIQVAGMDGQSYIDLPEVYLKNDIPVSPEDMVNNKDLERWTHLSHISLPKLEEPAIPRVTLMIGMNVPAATMPQEVVTGDIGEPYGVKTPLGWVIYGVPGRLKDHLSVNYLSVQDGLHNLEDQFKRYMSMDFSERAGECVKERSPSREDQRFLEMMEESTEYIDGHYQMGLPLKNSNVTFPDNHVQVQQRTEQLKRKFNKNPDFKEKYVSAMKGTLDKGYAEPVPDNRKRREDGKVWFIPHHGVYEPQKQKVRVVYDCTAVYGGTSLNQELLQGPDLTNGLVGVLMRFRQELVAIKADVEAMFYQVKVRPEDRDFLRFYWWPDGDLSRELEEYRMTGHVFGAVSSPSCANFALQKTASDHMQHYSEEAIHSVKRSFYVDDFCKSVSSVEEAEHLSQEVRELLSKGGFKLTKWMSNSRAVLTSIPKEEWAKEVKSLRIDEESLPQDRTLGVMWSLEKDTLGFEIRLKDRQPTRRGILSIVSSVYDPFGMACAVVLPAKLLLQDLCRMKLKWDEEIPPAFQQRWKRWLTDLPKLEDISIDRCFKPQDFSDPVKVQIHHYADASEKGYGVITYLRLENEQGGMHCSFVLAKARVAPLKQQSIPRLELTAATVASRVHNMIVRELEIPIDQVFFWTDSMTVIKYIRSESLRFHAFVANRLAVIRESSSPSQWRYVPSELNPADDCSRGLTFDQFITSRRWFSGPEFLWQPEEEWPSAMAIEDPDETDPEVKGFMTAVKVEEPERVDWAEVPGGNNTTIAAVTAVKTQDQHDGKDPVKKLMEYYSTWKRLKRAVAWWLRLKRILCRRAKGVNAQDVENYLTVDELRRAEEEILKWVQHEAFPRQIKSLQEARVERQDHADRYKRQYQGESSLDHLDPMMQEGLLRVGGRLQAAHIPEQTKYQIILPRSSHVTELIIQHEHQKVNHQGKRHVLADLRQRYWILKAGVAVKSVLKKCVTCKKVQAGLSHQKMAALPASRLQFESPAFTCTGMDYFGPFYVKQGRATRKRYGVVFTCLTSRAIHIEVAESLETSSCINAVRRCIARRGQVKELISDNGTNLVSANTELKNALEEWNQEELVDFTADRGIKWTFNPPAASHFGGIWERQIRTIRKLLQAILNEQHVKSCKDDEQLRTLMCEVEATLNGRPLTHSSDDPKDLCALSPNDLLLLRPNGQVPPPGVFTDKDLYARKRWRQVQYLANLFWKRWSREYLVELQKRQKWMYPERNIHPGDVVLVADNQAPRNSWPLGLVQETFPDKNGLVRSVRVKTRTSELVRPVTKLCLLLEQETTLQNI